MDGDWDTSVFVLDRDDEERAFVRVVETFPKAVVNEVAVQVALYTSFDQGAHLRLWI